MPTSVKEICEKAKELPDTEKLALVDALLMQLDRPDPELDTVWAEEARKRRQAYREGRLETRATAFNATCPPEAGRPASPAP
jgi:hypothetical protein